MPESPFVTCCWPRFYAALQLRSFLESQRHQDAPFQPLNQARAELGAVLCLRGFLKCQSCSMPRSLFVLQHCWMGWSGCPLCSASVQEGFVAPELWYVKKPPDLQHILFPSLPELVQYYSTPSHYSCMACAEPSRASPTTLRHSYSLYMGLPSISCLMAHKPWSLGLP